MRIAVSLFAAFHLLAAASARAQDGGGLESVVTGAPGRIAADAPAFEGRGAYITQIGTANIAAVRQTAPRARAEVAQRGDENVADVDQRGAGAAYASTAQLGDGNRAGVVQDGVGPNTLFLSQSGTGNLAAARQTAQGALGVGAVMAQQGARNTMSLTQDGDDNRAELSQQGDGNAMTAAQHGAGNRLSWMQQGNGLSDLGIVQEGGHAISIVQTGGR